MSLVRFEGESGGQLVRTALTLSLVTGRPFELAAFGPSGLSGRHLAYLRAAESLGGRVDGATLGSHSVRFEPSPLKAGDHIIDAGGGASATLVWQQLFFPLALAGGGELTVRGGTHLPGSPSYPYLRWVWMAGAAAFGFRASLFLKQAGFAPEGAGEFRSVIAAASPPPERVTLPARGTLRDVDVTSFVAGQPLEIAERQAKAAVAALRLEGVYSSAENMPLPSSRPLGGAVFIRAQFEHTCAGFTALSERGAAPEDVGRDAAAQLSTFLTGAGALDEHLSEQILVPAALHAAGCLSPSIRGETRYVAARVTPQARTAARVIEKFLPAKVDFDESGEVRVRYSSASV